MINGFYAAKAGARSYQTSLNVTANNIANVNTMGYQARRVSFSELVETNVSGSTVTVGNGSRISAITRNVGQGNLDVTSQVDVAISGDGFFVVTDETGAVSFTRAGRFMLSAEEDGNYVVTPYGDYVMDREHNRISADRLTPDVLQAAALYRFANAEGLNALGDGKFAMTEASGPALIDNESRILEGVGETSNVSLITEMMELMTAQRGYQYNLKMIQTADELEQAVQSMRT
jgi:flagellar basal-body rod protein FlgG